MKLLSSADEIVFLVNVNYCYNIFSINIYYNSRENLWCGGGEATHRPAKPSTPVRIRSAPPKINVFTI